MKIPLIKLRPHHFLCLQGYKGYNYNSSQVGVWDRVASVLKDKPSTVILVKKGKDSLCLTCPMSNKSQNGLFSCIEKNISELDKKVKSILGLKFGDKKRYSTVVKIMHEKINPKTHEELCSRCYWWQKGLCQDSFTKK